MLQLVVLTDLLLINKELSFTKFHQQIKIPIFVSSGFIKLDDKENSQTIKVFIFILTIFKTSVTNVI